MISVKLGHYMTLDKKMALKAIYLTKKKLFFVPLSFDKATSAEKIEVSHGLFPLEN